MISTKGIPPLEDPSRWSNEMNEFVSSIVAILGFLRSNFLLQKIRQCLILELKDRPTSEQLVDHPFCQAAGSYEDMAALVREAKVLKQKAEELDLDMDQ